MYSVQKENWDNSRTALVMQSDDSNLAQDNSRIVCAQSEKWDKEGTIITLCLIL